MDDPIVYTPTARPGSRAPHAWIAPERSTLDLFGRGFALLDFGAAAAEAEAIVRAARARGVPVTRQPIPAPAIRALYERRLVLVRPDGHVAWRGDTAPEDPVALWDVLRGAGATTGERTFPGIPGR